MHGDFKRKVLGQSRGRQKKTACVLNTYEEGEDVPKKRGKTQACPVAGSVRGYRWVGGYPCVVANHVIIKWTLICIPSKYLLLLDEVIKPAKVIQTQFFASLVSLYVSNIT